VDLERYKSQLEHAGVTFEPGLTPQEVRQIESRHGFFFPPDFRAFLMHALPVSEDFINWRDADETEVIGALSWPYRGLCFDIEHAAFWLRDWGPRPTQLSEAFAIAKDALDRAPRLVPILGHRYIPDAPPEPDNPVFSVYQTDIIYYGRDLAEYLENEFAQHLFGHDRYHISEPVKRIPFWSYLVDVNNGLVDDGVPKRT
jgi:hypothetical protein